MRETKKNIERMRKENAEFLARIDRITKQLFVDYVYVIVHRNTYDVELVVDTSIAPHTLRDLVEADVDHILHIECLGEL